MKFATSLALLIVAAQADASCEANCNSVPCGRGKKSIVPRTTTLANDRSLREREVDGRQNLGTLQEGLCDLADNYICNADDLERNYANSRHIEQAENYLYCDKLAEDICDCDNMHGCSEAHSDDNIIHRDAGSVNAIYKSCHCGETIIPSIKEETQVEQEAIYESQQEADYNIKGNAANKYVLKGGLQQWI